MINAFSLPDLYALCSMCTVDYIRSFRGYYKTPL
tara:strand:+ start:650 stop:751 length:102 start_codon:yes stop_codon:yes gene_type:complete